MLVFLPPSKSISGSSGSAGGLWGGSLLSGVGHSSSPIVFSFVGFFLGLYL